MACDKYDPTCLGCKKAKGAKRRHHRGAMKEMRLTLCGDLSGPHPVAFGTEYRYMLVVVAVDKKGRKLPFVRGLRSKKGLEVSGVMESIVKEVRCLDPGMEFVRFHTDSGRELLNPEVTEVLDKYKIMSTHTGGYDPQANGLAEKFVGSSKGEQRLILPIARWP